MNKITGNELAARGLEKIDFKIEVPTELYPLELPENPGEEFGIEQTKDVVTFAVLFANAIIESWKDGKITVSDIMNFMSPLFKLPAALNGLDAVPEELNDLDAAELDSLILLVQDLIEVDSDKAKLIVEKSIKTMYAIFELVKAIKK